MKFSELRLTGCQRIPGFTVPFDEGFQWIEKFKKGSTALIPQLITGMFFGPHRLTYPFHVGERPTGYLEYQLASGQRFRITRRFDVSIGAVQIVALENTKEMDITPSFECPRRD